MDKLLENIKSKYLPNASTSANAQSATSQTNNSGGDALLSDIRSRYGVTNNTFVPGTAKSEVVVAEKEKPTVGNRVGNVVSGAGKSYGSSVVSAAGVTSDVLSTSQKRVDDARKTEELARYQRNLDNLTADLASAKTDKEREKIEKRIQQTKNYIDQWNSFESGFSKDTEVAAEKLNKTADTLAESAQEDIDEAKEGLGFGGQLAVDLGVAGTQLAGDALVAAMTGGSSLLPMAIRSFGGGAQEARQEGATLGEQVAYGAGSAALSAAAEKLFSVAKPMAKLFGKGFADDFVKKLSGRLAETAAGRAVLSAISEGAEEAIEAVLNPVLKRVTYDEDAKITVDTLAEAGYNALIGAGLGGILGTAGEVNLPNRASSNSSQTEAANAGNATAESTTDESGAEAIVAPDTAKPYVGEMPRNAEPPLVKSPSLTAKAYLKNGETIDSAYGNKFRSKSATNAEKRLGIEPGGAAYVVASNVTKNGEIYYAKVTRPAIRKMLYTEKDQRLPVERLVLVDNLEQIFDSSVWAYSEGDRKWRDQTDGFDTLRASFYVDGEPYYADIKVKVVRDGKLSDSENVVYFLEPESIKTIKKVDTTTPTLKRLAPKIFFGANVPTIKSVAQPAADVNSATDATNTVGAAQRGFDPFTALQNKYGTLPSGENPVRSDDVLVSTNGTDRVSQSVVTEKGARVTPDEFVPLIENETVKGGFSFIPITNDATVQKAVAEIENSGWDSALREWTAKVRKGITSADVEAMGALLYNNAVNSGDFRLALDILADYNVSGRNAARALQARRILKTLTPQSRLYMIERSIQRMVDDMKLDNPITIPDDMVDAYINAADESARDAAIDDIQQYVADNIPATKMDKWKALRYTNMLGNFKTQVRNVVGNIAMAAITDAKNAVAAGIERLAGGKVDRAHSVGFGKELVDAARADFAENRDYIVDEYKYDDNASADAFVRGVMDKRTIFKWKPLEGYRALTNYAMNNANFGDEAFARRTYSRALASYLHANGVTAEMFNDPSWRAENQQFIDKARASAKKTSQEATFRDHNTLSDWVSKIGRRADTPALGKAVAEGVLPFRRTPANILVRAAEYSPLGIVKNAVDIAKAKSGGDVSGADIIDGIAKTLTGSGIFVLGMLLRNCGLLRGSADDDEKQQNFDELVGHQDYALELPDGTSVTIDWLTPASMPLFMGAELMDLIHDGGFELKDLEQSLLSIAEPMLEMSMLQGINDTLGNLQYTEGNNLGQLVGAAALSYLTQGLSNSLVGQITRSAKEESTMTYVDKESAIPAWMQKSLGTMARKTPGWDYNQIPYIDAWGRTEEQGDFMTRLANNLFNPAFVSKVETDGVDTELQRLYDNLGDDAGGIFPTRADKSFSVDGETYNLSADEYVTYATAKGQYSRKYVESAINSAEYKSMSDGDKAKLIGNLYKYANYKAKRESVPSYDNTDFHKAANAEKAGISPAQFYSIKEKADTNGNGVTKGELDIFFAEDSTLSKNKEDELKDILFPKK